MDKSEGDGGVIMKGFTSSYLAQMLSEVETRLCSTISASHPAFEMIGSFLEAF